MKNFTTRATSIITEVAEPKKAGAFSNNPAYENKYQTKGINAFSLSLK